MATIQRTTRAELDLIEIWSHIASDDPAAADQLLDRIGEVSGMLAASPAAGPSRGDLAPHLRFYPVGNYLIFYQIADSGIVVIRVLHGARDYRTEFLSKD